MELLGEEAPFCELRGEARGEEPFRGEGVRRRGDCELFPRNEGRVLGDTERMPAEDGFRDRELDGVRERPRGVPPLADGVAAAGDLAR